MRITRFPSLTEPQFLGCTAAFADTLIGELNAASLALRRLEGHSKGAAFSYEIALDSHRYGALIVLDRWAALVRTFGPHLALSARREIIEEAPGRVQSAETLISRVNRLIDGAHTYDGELVGACLVAFQTVIATFAQERDTAGEHARLGPLLPAEYAETRRIFLEDLAAR